MSWYKWDICDKKCTVKQWNLLICKFTSVSQAHHYHNHHPVAFCLCCHLYCLLCSRCDRQKCHHLLNLEYYSGDIIFMLKNLTVITTKLVAIFDDSLADIAQWIAFIFLFSCEKFPLSCIFWTFILLFLFCFFTSPFPHFLSLFFSILEKMFIFKYLSIFLTCYCKWLPFSLSLPLCLGVSGHIRKSFRDSVHTILATHKALPLIYGPWDKLLLDPSACKHFLLSYPFRVLLSKFPSWSDVMHECGTPSFFKTAWIEDSSLWIFFSAPSMATVLSLTCLGNVNTWHVNSHTLTGHHVSQ